MRPASSATACLVAAGACALAALAPPGARVAGAQDVDGGGETVSGGSASEGAAFLLVPLGARSVGLGRAITADRSSAEGIYWNPASLAGVERSRLFALLSNDFGTESQVLGVLVRPGRIRAAVAFHRLDLGSIQATDAAGTRLGEIGIRHQAFLVSAALPLPSAGVDVGLTYRLVQFVTDCSGSCADVDFTSTAHAFDVGAVAAVPGVPGLDVGLLLRHFGTGLSVGEGSPSDPLPARVRLGAAWAVFTSLTRPEGLGPELSISLRADVQEPWPELDDLDAFAGAELGWDDLLFVRVGYAGSSAGRSGPALGVGLAYDRFRLDLGRSFDDFASFGGDFPFQVSLSIGL